jgi:hypothetical protein
MGDSLFKFFQSHPLWAALIILFAVLPVIGLILPIFRKAFGSKGHEKDPSALEFNPDDDSLHPADDDQKPSKEA